MIEVDIRRATEADIPAVLAIEDQLYEDRAEAEAEGFLLSGGNDRSQYEEFISYGAFYIATHNASLVGFAFALPPGTPRLERLREMKDRFELQNKSEIFQDKQFAWMAKIGILPRFMRQGIGYRLYYEILQSYPKWHVLTTTVEAPMRNIPSERLHEKFGFRRIGRLVLGDRGTLQNVICGVHYHAPLDAASITHLKEND
jgi:ribosomal protein S18 acetylase RimI-like enzyme